MPESIIRHAQLMPSTSPRLFRRTPLVDSVSVSILPQPCATVQRFSAARSLFRGISLIILFDLRIYNVSRRCHLSKKVSEKIRHVPHLRWAKRIGRHWNSRKWERPHRSWYNGLEPQWICKIKGRVKDVRKEIYVFTSQLNWIFTNEALEGGMVVSGTVVVETGIIILAARELEGICR